MKLAPWRDFDSAPFEVQGELEGQPRAFSVWKWDGRLEATPQEIALWRVLAGWFAPRLDVDEAKQHECARVWSNPRFAGIALSAPCDEPSAHERLEARLQLRDWLGKRAALTDERIAELRG